MALTIRFAEYPNTLAKNVTKATRRTPFGMEVSSLDASYAARPHSMKASPIAVVFAATFQDRIPVSIAVHTVHWCDTAEKFSEFGSIRTT